MILIKKTSLKERFNLIDDSIPAHDDNRWLRQLSREELKSLRDSADNALEVNKE